MALADLQRLIEDGVKRAGTQRKLATAIQVSHSTISGWKDGTRPNAEAYQRLVEYAGEAERVRERAANYDPKRTEELKILSRVAAGHGAEALAETEAKPLGELWEQSQWRCLTTGPVDFFRVSGDSMEPVFPDGSFIAVARANTSQIPDRCPCVVLVDGRDINFKLVSIRQAAKGGREIELMPINLINYSPERYLLDRVEIQFIALGFLSVFKRNSPYPLPAGVFLVNDSGKDG